MPHKRTAPITCKYSKSEQLYLILLCKPDRKMQHTITTSADGSSTLQLTQFGEAYHSTNGAYTEATHIYIQCGLEHLFRNCGAAQINIFDVGFGTGLNCILAWAWQQQLRQQGLPHPQIRYCGIEKYPIQPTEAQQLNYPTIIAQQLDLLPDKLTEIFHLMHNCPWEEDIIIPRIPNISHSGNKFAAECSATTESLLSGNKFTPECSTTGTNTHLGNEMTSRCTPTTEMCQLGNKCTPECSATCETFSTEPDCREDDFILHKSRADIASLGAEYYREACRTKGNSAVATGAVAAGEATTGEISTGATGEVTTATTGDSEVTSSPAVIFYDTFSPATQPELWDEEIFRTIAVGCPAGSILATYCSKGTVKQALRGAGFTLERLAGPPGKRHILRGTL